MIKESLKFSTLEGLLLYLQSKDIEYRVDTKGDVTKVICWGGKIYRWNNEFKCWS